MTRAGPNNRNSYFSFSRNYAGEFKTGTAVLLKVASLASFHTRKKAFLDYNTESVSLYELCLNL